MTRRIFTLLPLMVPALLLAENKKEKINICESKSIDFMTDRIILKRNKVLIKCSLNHKENEKTLSELIENLILNPYEEDLIEQSMNILINDSINSDKNLFSNNNQYKKNEKIVMIILDSFMWIETDSLKLKAIAFMENEKMISIIEKNYLKPTYKNYLIYLNLGIKTTDFEPMLIGNDIKDRPYRLYFNVMNGKNDSEEINVDKILNICFSQQNLDSVSNNYSIKDALELFALSKMYPEKSTQLLNLLYVISSKTYVLDFISFKYNNMNKQFILASANIESIYSFTKKEHLKRPMAKTFLLGSKEAYINGDLFKSWTLLAKSISLIIDIEDKIDSDAELLFNVKSNFKSISNDLIKEYKKNGNNSNAKFIENESNSLMKKTFFVSKVIKKTSL